MIELNISSSKEEPISDCCEYPNNRKIEVELTDYVGGNIYNIANTSEEDIHTMPEGEFMRYVDDLQDIDDLVMLESLVSDSKKMIVQAKIDERTR